MARRLDDLQRYERPRVDEPAVAELLRRLGLDPKGAVDLGGTMSLNLHIPRSDEVLRVHPRFESRARVLALRELRRHVAEGGLVAGRPTTVDGREVIGVGPYLAELEALVDHVKPPPDWTSYVWMYRVMGRLHRSLAAARVAMPRPVVSTYGPPGSLRRWLLVTERAVASDPEAQDILTWVRRLTALLARRWTPATSLPCQVVHGDVRLGNVALVAGGEEAAYLDFGFAAVRPRIHDLAYSLPWIVVRPDGTGRAEHFEWTGVEELVDAYEEGAEARLTDVERRALDGYVAAVPLYMAATAGFTPEPAEMLRSDTPFFEVAEWALTNPLLPRSRPRRRG